VISPRAELVVPLRLDDATLHPSPGARSFFFFFFFYAEILKRLSALVATAGFSIRLPLKIVYPSYYDFELRRSYFKLICVRSRVFILSCERPLLQSPVEPCKSDRRRDESDEN
jgi:hypothetical protein